MKKVLFAFAAMIVLAACGNKQAAAPVESEENSNEVAFEVAKNYFFKNDHEIPASPKITTAEEFGKLFGMATTMGKDGKPTEIDFTKQFVLACKRIGFVRQYDNHRHDKYVFASAT